jgi:hypothetical protein
MPMNCPRDQLYLPAHQIRKSCQRESQSSLRNAQQSKTKATCLFAAYRQTSSEGCAAISVAVAKRH